MKISITLCLLITTFSVLSESNPWSEPIWKSPPLPTNPNAEFDSHDPYGLSIGVYIKTDCSIRFVWQGNGNLYCFNSLTSKSFFIDNPKKYIDSAAAFISSEQQ